MSWAESSRPLHFAHVSRGPQWSSSKALDLGPKGSRLETRFYRRSADLDKLTCPSTKNVCGNRVSKIQSLTEHHQRRHISSTENPADIISRGADPTDLKNLNLWWTGQTIFIEGTNNDFSSSEFKMDSF
ncbi:hypothetical protein AVEN_90663-1 [Araneus ventricosus]|uniref:Uncharacterized protein n=1 Tax=Araneus ventricosus TaxID=182803 RepID=A0A4Y2TTX7_ARAVE|nr:hypothetical protein AVEN_90663-1 [Araneus ventricosus]